MTNTKNRIFVDESGDPGLSNKSKRYFVFGFVYCEDPSELRKRLRRLLKKFHQKNKYPKHLAELKFTLPYTELIQQGYTVEQLDNDYSIHMPEIRSRALNIIHDYSNGVFAAIIDKHKVDPTYNWTPERLGNYVFAQTVIINVMNVLSPPNPPVIYYDKGRLSPSRAVSFNTYLVEKDSYFQYIGIKRYRGRLSTPIDTSSVLEPGIWAADLVAGAVYHKYANNEWAYANILNSKRIESGERIYWK